MAEQDRNQGADRAKRPFNKDRAQGGNRIGGDGATSSSGGPSKSGGSKSGASRSGPWKSDGSKSNFGSSQGGQTRGSGERYGASGSGTSPSGGQAPRTGGRYGESGDSRGAELRNSASRGGTSSGRGKFERPDTRDAAEGRVSQPRPHNARDLRSANRPDRERSPEIDDDVTGAELDRVIRAQIRNLEERSAEWVARHLVMAGRLLEDDPELAFQHALAASRRGGRLAAVREAVGLTAYTAGHYGEALREFRTFRRISGSNIHLAVMADCERGLGRPDRALELARSEDTAGLDTAAKVELAIVVAGARSDLGQHEAAVAALEIPQLDMNRAFSYSPRLFSAYADALAAAGRTSEAEQWSKRASVAENALGIGDSAEPDIIDLGEDDDEPAPARKKPHRRDE